MAHPEYGPVASITCMCYQYSQTEREIRYEPRTHNQTIAHTYADRESLSIPNATLSRLVCIFQMSTHVIPVCNLIIINNS